MGSDCTLAGRWLEHLSCGWRWQPVPGVRHRSIQLCGVAVGRCRDFGDGKWTLNDCISMRFKNAIKTLYQILQNGKSAARD